MIVTADDLMAHSRLDDLSETPLIEGKIAAAQSYIESFLGYAIETEYAAPAVVPPALKEAVLQLAAHLYENREAVLVGVNAQALPYGLEDILANFRRYSFGEPNA